MFVFQILDSELFEHMHHHGDYTHFYFCYRWFLLDFKRGEKSTLFVKYFGFSSFSDRGHFCSNHVHSLFMLLSLLTCHFCNLPRTTELSSSQNLWVHQKYYSKGLCFFLGEIIRKLSGVKNHCIRKNQSFLIYVCVFTVKHLYMEHGCNEFILIAK